MKSLDQLWGQKGLLKLNLKDSVEWEVEVGWRFHHPYEICQVVGLLFSVKISYCATIC